jgi:hypothetical protein
VKHGQHGKAGELFDAILGATWYDWLGLILLVAAAAWLIVKLKSLFQDRDDPAARDQGLLSGIGDLHTQGDLTDEEYRLIKGQLATRIERTTRREGHGE